MVRWVLGETAKKLVSYLQSKGGIITMQDLAQWLNGELPQI
jgi:gamma-glutamyltranspeptidase